MSSRASAQPVKNIQPVNEDNTTLTLALLHSGSGELPDKSPRPRAGSGCGNARVARRSSCACTNKIEKSRISSKDEYEQKGGVCHHVTRPPPAKHKTAVNTTLQVHNRRNRMPRNTTAVEDCVDSRRATAVAYVKHRLLLRPVRQPPADLNRPGKRSSRDCLQKMGGGDRRKNVEIQQWKKGKTIQKWRRLACVRLAHETRVGDKIHKTYR